MPEEKYNVLPTRFTLIHMQQRLAATIKGHSLLKRKHDGISLRLQGLKMELRSLESAYANLMKTAVNSYSLAKLNALELQQIMSNSDNEPKFLIIEKKFDYAGVRLFSFDSIEKDKPLPLVGLSRSGEFAEVVRKNYKKLLRHIVKLIGHRTSVAILEDRKRKLLIRVSSMEHFLIPKIKTTISYIKNEIEEAEREHFCRLKMIKRKKASLANPKSIRPPQAVIPELDAMAYEETMEDKLINIYDLYEKPRGPRGSMGVQTDEIEYIDVEAGTTEEDLTRDKSTQTYYPKRQEIEIQTDSSKSNIAQMKTNMSKPFILNVKKDENLYETPAPDKTPAQYETPTEDKTPEQDRTSAQDRKPSQDKTPPQDKAPEQDKTPAQDETPPQDKTPAQDKMPVQDKPPEQDRKSSQDKTPAPDETPAQDEAPEQDKSPEQDRTPEQDESSKQDDAPKQDKDPKQDKTPNQGGNSYQNAPDTTTAQDEASESEKDSDDEDSTDDEDEPQKSVSVQVDIPETPPEDNKGRLWRRRRQS